MDTVTFCNVNFAWLELIRWIQLLELSAPGAKTTDNCYCNLRQILKFTTTLISIYDRYYNSRQNRASQNFKIYLDSWAYVFSSLTKVWLIMCIFYFAFDRWVDEINEIL